MSADTAIAPWRLPRLPARLCVMLSGSGRTLLNLIDAINRKTLSADIALVIASRECLGAERARTAELTTSIMRGEIDVHSFAQVLNEHAIDIVALAGYVRKVNVPTSFDGRIVNIHPALLPKFGGLGMYGERVHAAVLAAGELESGCSVHLVTAHYDEGPVLLQRRCPVLPGDDPHALADRVFAEECLAYPAALEHLIQSHWNGGR